jgi:hypothetical protein
MNVITQPHAYSLPELAFENKLTYITRTGNVLGSPATTQSTS